MKPRGSEDTQRRADVPTAVGGAYTVDAGAAGGGSFAPTLEERIRALRAAGAAEIKVEPNGSLIARFEPAAPTSPSVFYPPIYPFLGGPWWWQPFYPYTGAWWGTVPPSPPEPAISSPTVIWGGDGNFTTSTLTVAPISDANAPVSVPSCWVNQ